MLESRPVLALIPARGGSKGLPRKNLALVAGKPMIEFSIRAALEAPLVDEVWLSSDDDEILMFGRSLGANIQVRPALFATDQASAADVVRHFIDTMSDETLSRDPLILYLQPTSPLRGRRHIDAALHLMRTTGSTRLLSVCEIAKSPFKAFKLDSHGRLISLFEEALSNARRQDLPICYQPNGAIYAFTANDFTAHGGFPSNGGLPFIMSEDDSVDVDSFRDIEHIEDLLRRAHG